jgi:deoxycytidylate deaminase
MSQPVVQLRARAQTGPTSEQLLREHATNELVFAVIGHVGSGTSHVGELLRSALEDPRLPGGSFDVVILKASHVIRDWAAREGLPLPSEERADLARAQGLQDLGDRMRRDDHAAVARALVQSIRSERARKLGVTLEAGKAVQPDGARRAFIIDSLRHPAEVFLLRNVYQTAFTAIGVVCDEQRRIDRLTEKFANAGKDGAKRFMKRDAKAGEKHGQRVEDAFHLSDYFVDNSAPRDARGKPNPAWDLPDQLARLIRILTHSKVVRPTTSETAMFAASGGQRRSACLSRQVGAALVDRQGNLVAVGVNEVPRAGGGVYGQGFADGSDEEESDERCAFRSIEGKRACSNTREQSAIIADLLGLVDGVLPSSPLSEAQREQLGDAFRKSPVGSLIEFSRAVHAEMDAILAAARAGHSPAGARMFVTTFPCHYCARHIVAAGVDEVQFIESYPKSKARELHDDSVTIDPQGWKPPSQGGRQVLFRPFTGVAPRLYTRAFVKNRDLKDDKTGILHIGQPDWGTPWDITRVSYTQLEAELVNHGEIP